MLFFTPQFWQIRLFKCCLVISLFWMPVSSIEGCFDRRSFRSIKVDSIKDKSQFNQWSSVSTELTIYQIRLKIFSLAVDKRTKNNQALSLAFYLHLLFHRNLCFDRTDVWFRSERPSIETTFDRTDLIPSKWARLYFNTACYITKSLTFFNCLFIFVPDKMSSNTLHFYPLKEIKFGQALPRPLWLSL